MDCLYDLVRSRCALALFTLLPIAPAAAEAAEAIREPMANAVNDIL